ncbi:MAG: aminodeoxychorismate lyase [Gammaproteobacteria bacterium]|jgi:4-amino-4-deoxychorismate lyase|nr:aminodeoxychorismate lyase [Gammaproteobacteria bacterium]
MIQLINGQPATNLSLADRGLAYGDGVFETIALQGQQLQLWQAHWQRLQHGLHRLGIEVDTSELQQQLRQDIQQALQGWSQVQGVLKIIVTRGIGGRGYAPPATPQLTRIVQVSLWPDGRASLPEQGVCLHLCRHVWGHNPALAGIKHLNRLDQVLARQEWSAADRHEGLMLNQAGHVQSGVMSNIFVEHQGRLYTPLNDGAGIDGIMAAQVMAIGQAKGIQVHQQAISMDFLQHSDGVFLTNSLNGIWPVVGIADQAYKITAMTRELQSLLALHVSRFTGVW